MNKMTIVPIGCIMTVGYKIRVSEAESPARYSGQIWDGSVTGGNRCPLIRPGMQVKCDPLADLPTEGERASIPGPIRPRRYPRLLGESGERRASVIFCF